jgi:hypothetical protein
MMWVEYRFIAAVLEMKKGSSRIAYPSLSDAAVSQSLTFTRPILTLHAKLPRPPYYNS